MANISDHAREKNALAGLQLTCADRAECIKQTREGQSQNAGECVIDTDGLTLWREVSLRGRQCKLVQLTMALSRWMLSETSAEYAKAAW